jgi:hypothetical protein
MDGMPGRKTRTGSAFWRPARALLSDEVLGDIERGAESGNAEKDRQCGMQKVAEMFVEFEECHEVAPSRWFAIAGE